MCVYVSVRNKTISKRSQNDLKTISKTVSKTVSKRSQKRSQKKSGWAPFCRRSPTFIESGYGDIRVPKCCFFQGNSSISAPKKSRAGETYDGPDRPENHKPV